uniref:Slc10a-6 n=1 Tax=Schmidtea mediterranea TaxID=79327 RepID=A0A0H3YK49_SCHMD|nr:slc10a-6 [Schmidtea mediterranea]
MWSETYYQMLILFGKFIFTFGEQKVLFDIHSCKFVVTPQTVPSLQEGNNTKLTINCSCFISNPSLFRKTFTPPKGVISISIYTYNKHVILPSLKNYRSHHPEKLKACQISQWCSILSFDYHDQTFFFIHANQVGVASIVIEIKQRKNSQIIVHPFNIDSPKDILKRQFVVKVIRNYKLFHSVFDYSATFIASLTVFSVGCCTDITFIKLNIANPKAVLISLFCQHLLMPLITMAIGAMLRLPTQLAYGLCAMSAIPGGGLAHLIVVLIQGDRSLSTTISLLNSILGVLFLSLWLVVFSWMYEMTTRIEYIVIWVAPGVFAHASGFFLRKFQPEIAQAILTWFSRPILLLSAILLITLGVYVNHYAFHYIDYQVVSALCLIIFGGYCIGGIAGFIFKESTVSLKTIAAENSVFNCLLVIPALRGALLEPDGDLAATIPLWGVFFTPAPIILYFIVHKIKLWSIQFVERRKRKQSQHFSIVSSLAKMAEGMSAVPAPVSINTSVQNVSVTDRTTSL